MPESPEEDLKKIEEHAMKEILHFAGKGDTKIEIIPVAFGLKSVNITFIMDEKFGGTDPIEQKLSAISGVNSVEVTDVRRAIG